VVELFNVRLANNLPSGGCFRASFDDQYNERLKR
jgi:hypothetical protein